MNERSHAEMADRILANLVRGSIASALANEVRTNTSSKRHPKAALALGDDLPSYLRSIHRLLSSGEMAAILRWHTETLYRRIKEEDFPAIKDSHRWKFDPIKVATWIEQQMDRHSINKTDEGAES